MAETTVSTSRPDHVPGGRGAPWPVANLPEPPARTGANLLRMIGPGAIILSLSIGSGEWLLGPKAAVENGTSLLWIATIAILLQTVFNIECVRYTVYTGEPILVGLTRLAPGPRLWRSIWLVLLFISVGPGWALASATAMAAILLGRLPAEGDKGVVVACGLVTMAVTLILLSVGKSVQRSLERFAWFACAVIFGGLLFLAIRFVPADDWARTSKGFVSFGQLPDDPDWVLLAAFAAYAAAGGIFNTATSNWFRDKGYGMGKVVGFIPALIGGKRVPFGTGGTVFEVNERTLPRFKDWLWYVRMDQWILFGLGAGLGMYLCVLLAVGLIDQGTELEGWSIAAYQAEAVRKVMGGPGWAFVLGIGAWVLFTTQLNCSDACVRQATEILWHTSPKVRAWSTGDVRRVYYLILVAITLWTGLLFVIGKSPLTLVLLSANAAAVVFVIAGVQVLRVNTSLIPGPLRPGRLTRGLMLALIVFYAFFAGISILNKFFGVAL